MQLVLQENASMPGAQDVLCCSVLDAGAGRCAMEHSVAIVHPEQDWTLGCAITPSIEGVWCDGWQLYDTATVETCCETSDVDRGQHPTPSYLQLPEDPVRGGLLQRCASWRIDWHRHQETEQHILCSRHRGVLLPHQLHWLPVQQQITYNLAVTKFVACPLGVSSTTESQTVSTTELYARLLSHCWPSRSPWQTFHEGVLSGFQHHLSGTHCRIQFSSATLSVFVDRGQHPTPSYLQLPEDPHRRWMLGTTLRYTADSQYRRLQSPTCLDWAAGISVWRQCYMQQDCKNRQSCRPAAVWSALMTYHRCIGGSQYHGEGCVGSDHQRP